MSFLRSGFKKVKAYFTGPKADEQTEPVGTFVDSDPVDSPPDDGISEEVECSKRLADAVKERSKPLAKKGSLSVYKIPLQEEHVNIKGCECFTFGKQSTRPNRTIMVLGATGAGKSTLINGMINYILGVEWKDSYRFKLVDEGQSTSQAHSQTSKVIAYKLNHQEEFKIESSLTIIDTPGFGDTRGIKRDREIVGQLRNLFHADHGVTEVDAVCFVVQSALARLTPTQKYVFDSVLSIFGKDVAENIQILVTFADGQQPPILEAIKASGVPCPTTKNGLPVHFKFNNSALFADSKSSVTGDDEDGGFDEMFWVMGTKSLKKFFAALNVIKTKSLKLTKEVLKERQQLEVSIENLQKQVKVGLAKLEEIKETTGKLKDHEAEINRNEKFEIETTVTKPFQYDISGTGYYITNCQQCHYTCHYPCGIPNDSDKRGCAAMSDGYCTCCPNKCVWNVHFNQKYKWEYKEVTEKQTLDQLKEKYLKATGEKTTVQGVIKGLKDEYDRLQIEVQKLIERSAKCLNRLKEIALKSNPLSTPDYIDMLIEGEKSEGKPGWKERVESLMAMKQNAEFMVKVEKGEKFLHTNTDGDEAKTNTDRDEVRTDADGSEEETNADGDEGKTDADRDEEETNADGGEEEINADEDEEETDADGGEEEINADGDEEEINADGDEEETDADGGEEEINADGGEEETDADGGEEETNADGGEEEINADEDEEETDADGGEEETNADGDEEETNADEDEEETNADEDEEETNADEDEEETNADGDEEETNADGDEGKTNADGDEEETNADGDEAVSVDS